MPGAPFRSTPELFGIGRGAPCLGEHDAEVSGFSDDREIVLTRTGGHGRTIDQLRVLTFGSFIAGNTTGLLLAELGADVVKIEALARPEVLRNPAYGFGPKLVVEPSGVPNTVMYGGLSRSTRNLSLEMNTEEGHALFRRLVAVADVVVENFGAETMPHWDCSFDDLLAVNPRLVMVSLSGYGRTGPRRSYLAYARTSATSPDSRRPGSTSTEPTATTSPRSTPRSARWPRSRSPTRPTPVSTSTSPRPKRSRR